MKYKIWIWIGLSVVVLAGVVFGVWKFYQPKADTPVPDFLFIAGGGSTAVINRGEAATIEWQILSDPLFRGCTASEGEWFTGGLSGSASVSPPLTTTYTLNCRYMVPGSNPQDPEYFVLTDSVVVDVVPTVVTNDASNIGTTTATLNGQVTDTGGAAIIECGFQWGPVDSATTRFWETAPCGAGTGSFSLPITELNPNTQYSFWAYAMNSPTFSREQLKTFTTEPSTPAPTVSLNASPASIATGGSSTLTWTSVDTDANSCTASSSPSTAFTGSGKAANDDQTVILNTVGTYTFTMTCTGPGGTGSGTATVTVTGIPSGPTVNLDANPNPPVLVTSGYMRGLYETTLTWSTSNDAVSCIWTAGIDEPNQPAAPTSGSKVVYQRSGYKGTYTLTCVNAGEGQGNDTVIVQSPTTPIYTLTVTLAGTGKGSVYDLPQMGINCGPIQKDCSKQYLSGTVLPLTATAETGSSFAGWSGACSGTSDSCSVTIDSNKTVTATFNLTPVSVPTVTLTANPATITAGGSSTLTWASTNATSCLANFSSSAKTSDSQSVSPTDTTTYTITCTGAGGSKSASTIVTVSGTVACTAPAIETRTLACAEGKTGLITQTRSKENPPACTWSEWQTTSDTCKASTCAAPLTETRTQSCPTGQTGSIAQIRTKGDAPTCAWSDWYNSSNNCTGTVTAAPTATRPTGTATTAARTGPKTPLVASGALALMIIAFYFVNRKIRKK